MPIKISFDKPLNILIVKISGYLNLEDYESAMTEIVSCQDYPIDVDAMWDLTEMKFDNIDLAFQKEVIAWHRTRNNPRGEANIALVSDYSLAEPLVKLFTILSQELNMVMKSFKTIESAQSWLKQQA